MLGAFVDGTLAAAERDAFQAHLRACPACWEVVALLGAGPETAGMPAVGGAAPVATSLKRGTLVSRYVLLERVGEGGMGVVYAAYDPELDRKVALKLLHPAAPGVAPREPAQVRLLREARSLARLSDPHVVPVFDAGTFEGRVFLAMEWVEGGTLAQWLRQRPRLWREVLEVLRRAGAGLAAAHAAGILHRDFKPDNLLMGRDGRVRVTDFGLARELDADEPGEEAREEARDGRPPLALTRTGAVLGTPAYMAPEQLAGRPLDARADQFSFCVTLYEALWGERPFAGRTLEELRAAIAAQQVRPPPGRVVPAWVRRIVLRGLRADPAERHSSMEALLAALARPPGQLQRRVLAGTLVTLGVLVALAVPLGRTQAARARACADAASGLTHAWDSAARERMQAAFARTGVPYAATTSTRVQETLDTYAVSWAQARRRSCEPSLAGWATGPEPLAARREECLEGAARDFKAVAELLAIADATVVENAARVSRSLPDLAACEDAGALARGEVLAPADPEARVRWEVLRDGLAAARARLAAGRFDEALTRALEARAEARAGGFPRLEAEALLVSGRLLEKLGRFKEAEAALDEAALTAEQARDDSGVAWARAALVGVVGMRQARTEDGERLARHAQVALARAGSPGEASRFFHNVLGMLRYQQGRFGEAEAEWRRSLDLWTQAGQAERHETAMLWSNLGTVLVEMGRYEEASTCLERALSIAERQLGADHPELAVVMTNLAMVWSRQGRLRESQAVSERVLELVRRVRPEGHPEVLRAMANVAAGYIDLGRLDEAWALYARVVADTERHLGASNPEVGLRRQGWGETLLDHGRPREALEQFRRCHELLQERLGERHVRTVLCLSGMGQARLKLGEPRRAVPLLEQALARFDPEASEAEDLARARFALAQALQVEPAWRTRAHAEALQARDLFVQAQSPARAEAVTRWLESAGTR